MRTIARTAFTAFTAIAITATAASAQDFKWSKQLAAGKTVQIKGTNGAITAMPSNGSEVRVEATKKARRSNPEDVRLEVVEHGDGVTICAVYPTPPQARRPNECKAGDGGSNSVNNNDVTVEWTVYVPRNVSLDAQTVNGNVTIDDLQSDVTARTVNGEIDVETTGLAVANTVNGSIDVVTGRNTWNGTLDFRTVNGSVSVTFPGDIDTEVTATTVNGDIETDWPLTVRGRFGSRSLNGTIGSGGGRKIGLQTVNGDISLNRK